MSPEEEIDELIKKSEFHFDCYHGDEAKETILTALEKARVHQLENKIVDCLDVWGYFNVKEFNDPSAARLAYEEGLSILLTRPIIDNNRVSSFFCRLGLTYYRTDPPKLIELTLKAIEYQDKTDEPESDSIYYSRLLEALGHGYRLLKDYTSSELYYLKCIDLCIRKNPTHKTELAWAHTIKELGLMYSESNQEEKASAMQERYNVVMEAFYKDKPWLTP